MMHQNALARFAAIAVLVFASASAAKANVCEQKTFENQSFTVCAVDLAKHDVRLLLKKPDGTLYLQPEALPRDKLQFAMNAGMFGANNMPIGLYVESGKQAVALNQRNGGGNFHMQPNGVFWMKDGKASVTPTASYANTKPAADLATQSGPMLVIDGAINPKFDANGPSRYVRNGVGVSDATHVTFAISNEPVSFGVFARLFRDQLKCPNALYLDGSVSQLYLPGITEGYGMANLGPLIAVYARE